MLKSGGLLLALAASPYCMAQEAAPMHVMQEETTAPQSSVAAACCRAAEGTVVTLEILEPLSSALVKRGDKFRLRLAESVSLDGDTALAAGLEGVGEIVHAEKSRGGGKPGELLIAARYLEHSSTHIPLRGLKLGGSGKDKVNAAMATAFAIGPLALFVHGREIVIPAGTLAQAKISAAVDLPPQSVSHIPQAATAAAESTIDSAPEPDKETALPPQPPSLPAELTPEGTITQPATNEPTQETKE